MMQELKHDLLESSKQLQSIKSKQDNDLQECICLFQYQLLHVAFFFLPNKHQSIYLNINSPNDNIMQQESIYKQVLTARRDA